MKKIKKLSLTDEQGNEFLCTIIMTCTSAETNKNYVLFYADGISDEVEGEEQYQVMAATYNITDNEIHLDNIENDGEWEFLEKEFEKMQNGVEYPFYIEIEGEDDCCDDDCSHCHSCGCDDCGDDYDTCCGDACDCDDNCEEEDHCEDECCCNKKNK